MRIQKQNSVPGEGGGSGCQGGCERKIAELKFCENAKKKIAGGRGVRVNVNEEVKLDKKEILFKDGMTVYNNKHKLSKAFDRL